MNWSLRLLAFALAVLGLYLAGGRPAPADAVVEPTPVVALVGRVYKDVDPWDRFIGYNLEVRDTPGRPPGFIGYRLVTANVEHDALLEQALTRKVRVVGRVGRRGNYFFLFVEEISENPPP